MSYQQAMEAAGAIVSEFKEFGSYQGDWWAKVTYEDKTGWVNGSYGSCSGCDAFEGEFGYNTHSCGNERFYDPFAHDCKFRDNCEICQFLKKRLVAFGKDYLECIMSQEEAEVKASENIKWDEDAKEMVDYLRFNRIVP